MLIKLWKLVCILESQLIVSYGVGLKQGGQALKMLATAARLDIEDFVGKEVFVEVRQTHDLHFSFLIYFLLIHGADHFVARHDIDVILACMT